MIPIPRFKDCAPVLAKNGYEPLPVHFGAKNPALSDWTAYRFNPDDVNDYAQAGTGILTGQAVALDNDVLRAEIAAEVDAMTRDMLGGEAPVRVGKAPKTLSLYRLDSAAEPFGYLGSAKFIFPGDPPLSAERNGFKGHGVEVLTRGKQFVAYNQHPITGQPYAWSNGEPLNRKLLDLPTINPAQALSWVRGVEAIFHRYGGEARGKLRQAAVVGAVDPSRELVARDPEECAEALRAIPNEDVPFDDWVAVLYAAKGAGLALEVFEEWSAKSPLHDSAFTHRTWDGGNEVLQIGAGSIYHWAEAAGWQRAVVPEDFYAYMPAHQYIFLPTGEMWPASSVNTRSAPPVGPDGARATKRITRNTKAGPQIAAVPIAVAEWLDKHRPVEQMTWAPGMPPLIKHRLVAQGGWIERRGCSTLNLYRPPALAPGDARAAEPWLAHVRRIVPDDAEHVVRWLAHRVQRPGEKINHALVLGGLQGIGKDTLLEPVKHAVGAWNFCEVSPGHMTGPFNGFVKSVILRVSEARDLGDVDRYDFYEHLKTYTAAPPDVLRCNEKNLREHYVVNVMGVIITTNHKSSGIYLPADDRRHHVAWSDVTKEEFTPAYWREIWQWYEYGGGCANVAAYLMALDLSAWEPKAPPPKTPAFWDIVAANRAPEDAELVSLLEDLTPPFPPAVTKDQLIKAANSQWSDFQSWLQDRRNAKALAYRMEAVGYVPVRNDSDKRDGLWKMGRWRCVIYARKELSVRERHAAARALAEGVER